MGKYILDTNIIINIWKKDAGFLERFLEFNEILIIREVLEELSKKEKRRFNGSDVMSERFMKLVPFLEEVDRLLFKKFINEIDFDNIKGKAYYIYGNKLTEIDMLLIYATKSKEDFILVSEDKGLVDLAKDFLGEERVCGLKSLI